MAGAAAGAPAATATVVVMCAEWCDVCRTLRPSLGELAAMRRDVRFVWLDIEDDAALVGDVDVENFPMLAIFRGDRPVFFGVSLPQQPVIARLVSAMVEKEPVEISVPDAIAALPGLLRSRASLRTSPA